MRKQIDVTRLDENMTWPELKDQLESERFYVDHYHGLIETENEEGTRFQNLVHVDAFSGAMSSTLMGVGSELPADFVNLNADEWHELGSK